MTIRFNLKPIIVGGLGSCLPFNMGIKRTKQEIVSAVRNSYGDLSNPFRERECEIAVNYEKRNPVYKQIKFKNGKTKKTELVRPGHWVAYVYKIPKNWPVKIVQHSRHFTLESK